jgi:uncharacterized membrane protein YphA (DoxX/SURF4 family)
MSAATVVGLKPWLPPPLARSPWWTEPVPAERQAALRVGVGAVLLLDVLGTYLPRATDFFGPGSLTAPGTFTGHVRPLEWHRVLMDHIQTPGGWVLLLWLWALSALFLMLGILPRGAATVAWFFSISLTCLNPTLHNSGDQVRNILLFYLMLCPCGAVWSVRAWWRRRGGGHAGPVFVYPWALRLLFVQLVVIYFMNGLFKLRGDHWRDGMALASVLHDAGWTRWSFAGWPMPGPVLQAVTYVVLAWELLFPLLVLIPWLRKPALWMGVLFHVGTGVTMRLGPFPLYMLCLYLPLLPWERWARATGREGEAPAEPAIVPVQSASPMPGTPASEAVFSPCGPTPASGR